MTPRDEAFRERARRAEVNVLVEAGAGTGKTTLLLDRVVDGLIRRRIPLSRMLLITFMDKAQEDMRRRLELRLHELAEHQQLSSQDRAVAQTALEALPAADITTIHGFCYRILSEFGVDYGIPVGFRVLDAVETERLWHSTYNAWLQRLDADGQSEVVVRLLHGGIGWSQLQAWARQISRWAQVPDVDGVFPDVAGFVHPYAQAACQYQHIAMKDARPEDQGLAQITDICRRFEWLEQVDPNEWPRMLAQWHRGLAPKGNKKNWAHPQLLADQKLWVKGLQEDLERLRQQMADAYLADWVRLVGGEFRRQWRRIRFEQLALTYDDLLIEAERVTREAAVWSRLRTRYDLVMVDEFQDTDAMQTAIIKRLVTPVGSDRLSPEDQGRLFLVGDPKQSIYRFRGADVEVYASMRDELTAAGGQVLPISQNFRSHPQILQYVNQLFQDRWPDSPDAERPFVPVFFPLLPSYPDDGRTHVGVHRLAPDQTARGKRRAEAAAIAELIRSAVEEVWPVRRGDGETRGLSYRDIALVVPQRTEIGIYRRTLKEEGIPVASQTGRAFFQQDEIRGLYQLFRALEDPDDETAAAGWLLSPWVGMNYAILAQHRLAGGNWDYRQRQAGHPEVLGWWDTLWRWHQNYWRADPETILDWAVSESALPAVLEERQDWAALANLEQMRRLSREFGDRWGIFEFSRWFTAQVAENVPFEEAPVLERSEEVLITTAHQSKGLEWPMVIVANWHFGKTALESGIQCNPRLGRAALHQEPWTSRDWAALDADHRVREEAETDRLLYVALTRARDYLWFYTSFMDDWVMPGDSSPGSETHD
ncbi:MAG: UvrD-helicase domain-containing protein [Thermaerobacter sp.]|nr:UvrD-helicase domain-containing protein [Thermaerobacter sp.]